MWSAICSKAPHSQFGEGVRPRWNSPNVIARMELPNTSPQAIELNPSCLRQAQSNRPGTGDEYESTNPRCILTVLRVSSLIRPLDA